MYFLALLNTKVTTAVMDILNPTMNHTLEDMKKIPIVFFDEEKISEISKECISLSKSDWDSFETSWNFKRHPLI